MNTTSDLRNRVGELAWGQAMYYNLLAENQFDVGGVLFTYLGYGEQNSLETVTRKLRLLIRRHDSLRTLYEYSELTSLTTGDASVQQRVFENAEIPIHFFDASDRAELPSRRELAEFFRIYSFDLRSDFPILPFVVGLAEENYMAAAFISHSAIDGLGLMNLRRDFTEMESPEGRTILPEQPIDRALDEKSEKNQRKSELNLQYLRGMLKVLPNSMLSDARISDVSLFAKITSTQMTCAVGLIARAASVSPATVIAGVFALLQSVECATETAMVRSVFSRGYDLRSRYIAPNHLHALLAFETHTADTPVEFFRRAQVACFEGYAHCDYDPTTFLGEEFEFARAQGIGRVQSFYGGIQFEREPAAARLDWWPTDLPILENSDCTFGTGDRLSSNSRVAIGFWPSSIGSTLRVRATHWVTFESSQHFARTFELFLLSAARHLDAPISHLLSKSLDGDFVQ